MMRTHTFVMHIFRNTQQKNALPSYQCNVCSLYTWDRFYVSMYTVYTYLSRYMLKYLETASLRDKQLHIVSIKDTTQIVPLSLRGSIP